VNGARFVAAGHQGLILASADGRTWSVAREGKEGEAFRAVVSGGGRWAAAGTFGGANLLASSADGRTWSEVRKDGQYRHYLRGMAHGGGTFVGIGGDPGSVGDSKPFVMLSAEGTTWSDFTFVSGKHILRRMAFGNGIFVGVGDRGRRSVSRDAKEWTDAPGTKAVDTLVDVAFGAGLFVGVGLHGLRMATRDGLAWEAPQRGEEGEHLNSVVWAGDRFVAPGQGATYVSKDGLAWTRHANAEAPQQAAWSGGIFCGVAWKGRILASGDGIAWETVHKAEHALEAVAAKAT
jgi:hypothetical protein